MSAKNLFITFANQLASPAHIALFADIEQQACAWVNLDRQHVGFDLKGTGAAGACQLPSGRLIFCTQGPEPAIVLLRLPEGEIITARRLLKVVDPHSLAFFERHLYIVSTGTNEIYRIALEGDQFSGEELFWHYPKTSRQFNEVHLNGITRYHDTFIATSFGEKKPAGNATRNGTIFFVDSGELIAENLNQPHSPLFSRNQLFVAESGHGRIHILQQESGRRFKKTAEVETGGYPRGLLLVDDCLYVGISSTRNISKSQQEMLGSQDLTNVTSIERVNLSNFRRTTVCSLQPFAREIYDLSVVETPPALTSEFACLRSRTLEMESMAEQFFQNQVTAIKEVERLDEHVRSMRSSLSWRITFPLRWLADKTGYRKKR